MPPPLMAVIAMAGKERVRCCPPPFPYADRKFFRQRALFQVLPTPAGFTNPSFDCQRHHGISACPIILLSRQGVGTSDLQAMGRSPAILRDGQGGLSFGPVPLCFHKLTAALGQHGGQHPALSEVSSTRFTVHWEQGHRERQGCSCPRPQRTFVHMGGKASEPVAD